jgi:hypothetical protein
MRVCAITMAHNERFHLPIWVAHYSRQVGRANLFVLDHGTTDESLELIAGLPSHFRIARDIHDNRQRLRLVRGIFAGLLAYYDAAIYSDADELLVADPGKYADLVEFCAKNPAPCHYALGLELWQLVQHELPIDFSHPILEQRKAVRFSNAMCKPLVGREPLKWNPGFHTCQHEPALSGELFLFHLKYMDRLLALERLAYTRSMAWSAAEVAKGWGKHQRRRDAKLDAEFLEVQDQALQTGLEAFDFSAHIDAIRAGASRGPQGLWTRRDKLPPTLAEVPARFRHVF